MSPLLIFLAVWLGLPVLAIVGGLWISRKTRPLHSDADRRNQTGPANEAAKHGEAA